MSIIKAIGAAFGAGGDGLIPGEVKVMDGEIELNAGRAAIEFDVANSGDRTIMIGSHYHFYEVNDALQFDREQARGYRLDLPPGHTMIFEPGQTHHVRLVPYVGARVAQGFHGKINGAL